MAEQMNIYQKLARIRKQVEVIQKNKSGYGYKYVSEDEILAKISVFMDKYGLSLIPNIKQGSTIVSPYTYKKTKTTGKGDIYEENNNEVLVSADMTWSWVNNDNPEERIDVEWALVGQQGDASQAFGSGLRISRERNDADFIHFFNLCDRACVCRRVVAVAALRHFEGEGHSGKIAALYCRINASRFLGVR